MANIKKKLYIAEKPEVNEAIAKFCAKKMINGVPTPFGNKGFKFIDNENVEHVFIPLSGHVLRLIEVSEYPQYKNFQWDQLDVLPIIPDPFVKAINFDVKGNTKSTERYENIIKQVQYHIVNADVVYNVADSDDEGQLLFDELIEYLDYKGKVLRWWTSGLTDFYLEKSFSKITENERYYSKGLAAKARAESDWMYGINHTILCSQILGSTMKVGMVNTPKGSKVSHSNTVFSVGRVQTPVLNIIFEREQEHKNFVPTEYYTLSGQVSKDDRSMPVRLDLRNEKLVEILEAEQALNTENQLIKREVAEQLKNEFGVGMRYKVAEAKVEKGKKEAPPLALGLTKLQKECNKLYGLSVAEVQDIAQRLHLARYITYHRNGDCEHLTEDEFDRADEVIGSLKTLPNIQGFKETTFNLVDPTYHGSKVWNDAKVAQKPHSAIIPTGELNSAAKWHALKPEEQQVFAVVAQYYLYQFMLPAVYNTFNGEISHDSLGYLKLLLSGKQWVERSFKDAFESKTESDKDNEDLPNLQKGDEVTLNDFGINTQKTKRPPLMRDTTLLEAMVQAYKYVKDPSLASILQGKSEANSEDYGLNVGIGTSATRVTIINQLIARGYVKVADDGSYTTTPKAAELLANLPDALKFVDLTAKWQQELDDLRMDDLDEYMLKFNEIMGRQKMGLHDIFSQTYRNLLDKTGYKPREVTPTEYHCSKCNGVISQISYFRDGSQHTDYECLSCKTRYVLFNGEMIERFYRTSDKACLNCGKKLIEMKGVSEKGPYHCFKCGNEGGCNEVYNFGAEGEPTKSSRFPLTEFECLVCQSKLRHVKMDKTLEDGSIKHVNFFSCSNEKCKTNYSVDENDKPKYPVYLEDKCPACSSKVLLVSGISKKTNEPYRFGRCENLKCRYGKKEGSEVLSLNEQDRVVLKKYDKPCPDCGGTLFVSPRKLKDGTIKHLYSCQNNKCLTKTYWGDENGFQNPFEPFVNSKGDTQVLLKDVCQSCKKHHLVKVVYSDENSVMKRGSKGYVKCQSKPEECGVFYNEGDDGSYSIAALKSK